MPKIILIALLATAPFAVHAQHGAHDHLELHQGEPIEPGQAAFAAVAEIVMILENDPDTDWSEVDIDALRRHLIDMNNVMLKANVRAQDIDHGARFVITGAGAIGASIKRMTQSHARMMNGVDGWIFDAKGTADGILLSVTSQNDAEKIRALGYAGVMARGAHHQQHHLLIAKGMNASH